LPHPAVHSNTRNVGVILIYKVVVRFRFSRWRLLTEYLKVRMAGMRIRRRIYILTGVSIPA